MSKVLVSPQSSKTKTYFVSEPEAASAPTPVNPHTWAEAKALQKHAPTISLRNSILLLTLFAVVSVALVSVVPSYTFGFSAVGSISDQLQDQTMERIKNQVQSVLDTPHAILKALHTTVQSWQIENISNYCNHFAARETFMGVIDGSGLSVRYGSADGGVAGLSEDKGVVTLGCGDKYTNYSLAFYLVNSTLLRVPANQLPYTRSIPRFNATTREWYTTAVRAKSPTWGAVYSGISTSGIQLTIPASRPIYDSKNMKQIVGVISAAFFLTTVQEILDNIKTSDNGYAYILQKDTKVIANTLGAPILDAQGVHYTYLQTQNSLMIKSANYLQKDSTGKLLPITNIQSFTFTHKDTDYFALASTLIDPRGGIEWTIVVLIPRSDIFAEVDRMIILSSVLTAVLFVVTLIITLVVSTYITRPLNVVADAMHNISRLEFQKAASKGSDSSLKEIRIIQSSFQVMDTALQSFGKYVPMSVVKRIVGDDSFSKDLHVDRKRLTIMFSDIKNFTQLAETLAIDTLLEILAEYLEEMTKLITASDGLICDFIGDGIMAMWNSPVAIADHERVAMRTAVQQQKALQSLNKGWLSRGYISEPLCARIGIHTGDVLVGNIGSHSRMKYGAVGDAVNLASRLEGLNKRYGTLIMVSDATLQGAAAAAATGSGSGSATGSATGSGCVEGFYCRPLEKVVVKGRSQKVEIFELVETKPGMLGVATEAELEAKCKALEGVRQWETMTREDREAQAEILRKYVASNTDETASVILNTKSNPAYAGYTAFEEK